MPLTKTQFNKAVCILRNIYDDPTVLAYINNAASVNSRYQLCALLADSLKDSPYISIPFLVKELELDYEEASTLEQYAHLCSLNSINSIN